MVPASFTTRVQQDLIRTATQLALNRFQPHPLPVWVPESPEVPATADARRDGSRGCAGRIEELAPDPDASVAPERRFMRLSLVPRLERYPPFRETGEGCLPLGPTGFQGSATSGHCASQQGRAPISVDFLEAIMQGLEEILGSGEAPACAIPSRLCDSDQESLKLSDVIGSQGQVNAEAIPGPVVAISEVRLQAAPQVRGQPYVVEAVLLVERVNPMAPVNQLADDAGILLQNAPGDFLKVLAK